jgi:ssRNA-specific RNase YbeY (16S rRNA maturation enzyme)
LLGYDDIRPTERALMRRKEKKLLLHLRKNGLLLSGTFR